MWHSFSVKKTLDFVQFPFSFCLFSRKFHGWRASISLDRRCDRHIHRHVESYTPDDVYSPTKGDKLEALPSSKAYFKHIDVVEINHFSEARGIHIYYYIYIIL